ncbi:hypothetical protein TL16_g00611, partial [Triparma laevis f. inornata]
LMTLFAAASAFSPAFAPASRSNSALNVERREVFSTIAASTATATLFAASPALADGAKSTATKTRARGVYGGRIANLSKAVNAGDFGAVVAEKNAFVLFNSGAIVSSKQADAIDSTNAIFAAIRSQDKSALKKSYDAYCKKFDINALPDLTNDSQAQGYSNDYDFRVGTKAGKIYVR